MYLSLGSGLHGQATSSWPSASGMPTECRHLMNSPSPKASSTLVPMRVMIRMLMTTYGESVIWMPMCEIGEPIGPMLNGITYSVRPFMQPSNFGVKIDLHLARRHPVVGRAGVALAQRADVGAVLDPGDVAGMAAGQEAVGPNLGIQADERAALDHLLAQRVVLFLRAVAPVDVVRLAERRHLFDPGDQLLVGDRVGDLGLYCEHRDKSFPLLK